MKRTSLVRSVSGGALIACVLVIVGCAACPSGKHVPRLLREDVIKIANTAARESGVDIARFHAAQANYEYVDRNCTWSVFYEGITPNVGNHFLVIVNDSTGSTKVYGGM
jgi:hypothetical protein